MYKRFAGCVITTRKRSLHAKLAVDVRTTVDSEAPVVCDCEGFGATQSVASCLYEPGCTKCTENGDITTRWLRRIVISETNVPTLCSVMPSASVQLNI